MTVYSHWDQEWPEAFGNLKPELAEVDRDALGIWLSIYPLLLLELQMDPAAEKFFQMKGKWSLRGQEDRSHAFLYAHAWWGSAKQALLLLVRQAQWEGDLKSNLQRYAAQIEAPTEHRLTLAFLGLMTLRQCGPDFLELPFSTPRPQLRAEEVVERRKRSAKGGFLSSLLGRAPKFNVCFDESKAESQFPILSSQEITTAAELDKRPYHLADERCYEGMGPIPVDCRSGSCGTCWVGVLGGKENLEPLGDFERKRMQYFGYWDSGFSDEESAHPRLRLACQAKAFGNLSLIIPPWNGVFGETRRNKERK